MSRLIEALIVYIVLFFSGTVISIINGAQNIDFSTAAQIRGILLYSIPSLALIWYLLHRAGKVEVPIIKPGKKDLICGLITLPCILLIGFTTSSASYYIGGSMMSFSLNSPSTAGGWIILCLSCIISACLEESYFRYYLLKARDELKLNALPALLLSTALFSICHIYEGPWGFMNAALSGALLCFLFLRFNSLHGIAAAHGLYNISVFVINFFLTG